MNLPNTNKEIQKESYFKDFITIADFELFLIGFVKIKRYAKFNRKEVWDQDA